MQKATIVLEGGATRGIFTSGVLDYLMEQELYVSHVIGVSAGSCNAVDYVSRQPYRTKDCMIPTDKNWEYVNGIGKFVKEKSLLNMDLIFDIFPNYLIPFDFDTFFKSKMVCEIVATNCQTGKAEYFQEKEDAERLMRICRASSSMPLVTPIVNVDDIPYLDGGLADSIPLKHALDSGNEKVILVLTRNDDYRKKPINHAMAELYRRAYSSYPELVRTILRRSFYYNRTMNQIEALEREGRIFVIRPQVKPVSRMERNAGALTSFYDHGYELMQEQYQNLLMYLDI